jgi:hypothetical protein
MRRLKDVRSTLYSTGNPILKIKITYGLGQRAQNIEKRSQDLKTFLLQMF